MPGPLPLSALIIAKNEADTVAVARAAGARVEQQDWRGFAGQKNEAIARASQP